jgi:hypothetical protein
VELVATDGVMQLGTYFRHTLKSFQLPPAAQAPLYSKRKYKEYNPPPPPPQPRAFHRDDDDDTRSFEDFPPDGEHWNRKDVTFYNRLLSACGCAAVVGDRQNTKVQSHCHLVTGPPKHYSNKRQKKQKKTGKKNNPECFSKFLPSLLLFYVARNDVSATNLA